MQRFLTLIWISLLGYQQMSVCELINGLSLIWAFVGEGPLDDTLYLVKPQW